MGKAENSRRKSDKGSVDPIRIVWARDHEQEIAIRRKTAPASKRKSAFHWFEEFTMEWSETFIPRIKKKSTEKKNHDQHS
jgi:hypothetical protein